jgi:hypothetical protein
MALSGIFGLPITWLLGGSAFAGAAIGFGASQAIGNFLSGIYLIINRPFSVGDYVKIGNVEGQVEEISIAYTTIYTPTHNLLKIPNVQVLNSQILNSIKDDLIDYTFNVGFSHEIPNEALINNCIIPAIEEFYESHRERLPRKPEWSFATSDRSGRSFAIRIFFNRGEAKTLYNLQPELLQKIVDRWDSYKKGSTVS